MTSATRTQCPCASASLNDLIATLQVVLDSRLQRRGVRTNHLADLIAVLEEEEGRHGAHGQLLRNFRDLVDVELVKAGVGVRVGVPAKNHSVSDCANRRGMGGGVDAYLTTCGAMTLQGPHHVAKQSTTIRVSLVVMASSNSALFLRLCTPSLPIVTEKLLKLVFEIGVRVVCLKAGVVLVVGVVRVGLERRLVSSVLRKAEDAADIYVDRERWELYVRGVC